MAELKPGASTDVDTAELTCEPVNPSSARAGGLRMSMSTPDPKKLAEAPASTPVADKADNDQSEAE